MDKVASVGAPSSVRDVCGKILRNRESWSSLPV